VIHFSISYGLLGGDLTRWEIQYSLFFHYASAKIIFFNIFLIFFRKNIISAEKSPFQSHFRHKKENQ